MLATLLVFAVAAVCVRLGIWQLDRLAERRARNAEVAARLDAAPIELDEPPGDSTGWLHRRVVLHGTYEHDRTIVYAGRSFRGTPGVHIVTPLRFHDAGAILVNRGWLPAADAATVDLGPLAEPGAVAVTGLVVPFPGGVSPGVIDGAAPRAGPGDGEFRRVWFAIDPAQIRAQFPYALGEIAVQQLGADRAGLPVHLPAPRLDDGPHLGYAIQWFSFAAIALVGWGVMAMRRGDGARGIAIASQRARE